MTRGSVMRLINQIGYFVRMKFAVINTGGKQYLTRKGESVKIEKIEGKTGDAVTFDSVFATGDEKGMKAGTPIVSGVIVKGTIVKQGRAKKVMSVKYKNKTRYKRTLGHRQAYTEVKITTV